MNNIIHHQMTIYMMILTMILMVKISSSSCRIMSIFPPEYDTVSEVSKVDEDFVPDETAEDKPLCYYVMNNGVVEE